MTSSTGVLWFLMVRHRWSAAEETIVGLTSDNVEVQADVRRILEPVFVTKLIIGAFALGFIDYAWAVSLQKDNTKVKILQDEA